MEIIAIQNPITGNKDPQKLKGEVEAYLKSLGVKYDYYQTGKEKHAEEIAKDACEKGVKLIIVIGGDGTINEVINSIAFTDVKLGIVPNGTGNLLATSLGIPIDTRKALKIIFEGKCEQIDLGRINNQYFSIIAGCGFDAAIMKNVAKSNKKLLGLLAYFLEGFKQAIFPKRAVFKLVVDDKKIRKRALNVLFINSANILGNFITLAPNSSMTDGLLDVCIFSPKNTGEFIPVLWKILTKQDYPQNKEDQHITHFKAKRIKLVCRPKLMVQADGDVLGYSPVEIEACQDAVNVMIPLKVSTFMMNPEEFLKSIIDEAFGGKM